MTAEDRIAISDMLLWRDVSAFVRGDWEAVESDFDPAVFVGYAGRDGDGLPWQIAYPTLEHYRDDWLEQSRSMRAGGYPDLERQLLQVQRLASIEVNGQHALVHKVFDGELHGPSSTLSLNWHTYYFLRRGEAPLAWLITGFAGYLGAGTARISAINSVQHETAGPYSPALRVSPGSLVVLSGQGPLDERGAVIGLTIEDQTAATMENCMKQLEAAGASIRDVFKANVYLADLADWDQFNDVYRRYFPAALPVRATVGVSLLHGMRIEIEMWAAPCS